MDPQLEEALYVYLARNKGLEEPHGKRDRRGRWRPTRREKQRCCKLVKNPTDTEPDTLWAHCLTIEHVANMYKVGVGILGNVALEEGSEEVLRKRRGEKR